MLKSFDASSTLISDYEILLFLWSYWKMEQQKEYILGTDHLELYRLGYQHQVWSSEAREGWNRGRFTSGMHLLDLGSGPGFCTMELASLAGRQGSVTAVDLSVKYLDFLNRQNHEFQYNIHTVASDFKKLLFDEDQFDGVYSRWALAWFDGVEQVVAKVAKSMKSGARWVSQEYYDWSVFQTEPRLPQLAHGIAMALKSFEDSPGNIHIGRKLSGIFSAHDFEIISLRPLSKIAVNGDHIWHWPIDFLKIYLPKVMEYGLLTESELQGVMNDITHLESIPNSTILCPMMLEIVVEKK